jgi:carboxymethylenebutenolidase
MSETLYFGEPGAPLVVIIHDWFGRLPWLGQLAMSLASEGMQIAVPDFLDGRSTTDPGEARLLVENVDIAAARAVIDDIIDEARLYGTEKVGEVGFSTGGWLALVHAQGGTVDAVVAYYASLTQQHHGVIPCPLLLQFAESDNWEYGADPASFYRRLDEHGTPTTRFTYLGTEHHFANSDLSTASNLKASALAHARTSAFLAAHLID